MNGRIITSGNTPTIASPIATVSIDGNDTAGTVIAQTASGIVIDVLAEVTFTQPYQKAPRITLTPTSRDAAGVDYFVERSAAGFTIRLTEDAPVSGSLNFDYQIIQ